MKLRSKHSSLSSNKSRHQLSTAVRAGMEPLEDRLLFTTYYVSLAGTPNGNGSITKPWNAVAKLNAAHLVAGDTVLFRGGDFFDGTAIYFTGLAGTSSSPIAFGS